MTFLNRLIEIKSHSAADYKPLIDYDNWRVACLNYSSQYQIEEITTMQKHIETDEVFVLLKGSCVLFLADGDEEIVEINAYNMEPLKIYNVKRSVWHTHTLSKDGSVLIVENRDTSNKNSPVIKLNKEQQKEMARLLKDVL